MKARKYFPLGKAYGVSFCNRVKETQWLVSNLNNAKHSLIIAPRRYGKSSLAEKAIAQAKLPFININFHLCTTEAEVSQLIVNQVINLLGKSVGQFEKIISSIKKYVSNLNPKLSFGGELVTLELSAKENVNHALVISESLLLLEKMLLEKNKKVVIFFDEFQEVSKIGRKSSIEGAIRTAAQEMENVTIIFSGSIRSLLLSMFEDESKPLYKLCRKLKLERISAEDYKKHLNKIANATWGKPLNEDVFLAIMQHSNRHPYYVNYLCDIVWEMNDQLPTISKVEEAWAIVIEEEWSDTLREFSVLSLSQKKVLKFIAMHNVTAITSQETSLALQMPLSSIASSIEPLLEKDYIEIDEVGQYKIINPLLLTVLRDQAN